jgi:c-di-GMP-binding flagellar brake protein YcgR
MADVSPESLREAIARNAGAVLSLPSAGMVRHHKTRFLAEASGGFWIEAAAGADQPLIDALIAEGKSVGISFRANLKSILFTTPVQERRTNFEVNAETRVEALLLDFPKQMQQKQRRQAYRATLPEDHGIELKLWRMTDKATLLDRPLAALELTAQISDLSVGGMGITCSPQKDGQPAKGLLNERVRVELAWGGKKVLTEGCIVRRKERPDKFVAMGIEFKKLESDLEGRQLLAKLNELVGNLQRDEIRRLRHAAA